MKFSKFEGIVVLVSTIYNLVGLFALYFYVVTNYSLWGDSDLDIAFLICVILFIILHFVIVYVAFKKGSEKLLTWSLKEKIITLLCVDAGLPVAILIIVVFVPILALA